MKLALDKLSNRILMSQKHHYSIYKFLFFSLIAQPLISKVFFQLSHFQNINLSPNNYLLNCFTRTIWLLFYFFLDNLFFLMSFDLTLFFRLLLFNLFLGLLLCAFSWIFLIYPAVGIWVIVSTSSFAIILMFDISQFFHCSLFY